MSTPSTGVIDDYLEGLLHDAITAAPDMHVVPAVQPTAPTQRAAEQPPAAERAQTQADSAEARIDEHSGPELADLMPEAVALVSAGPSPEALAAMVLAEADADPALAGIMSAQAIAPAKSGPSPEALAAMVLAEADADPALAGIMSAQAIALAKSGPSPEELAAMVLAEADADPALAGIMSAQAIAPVKSGPSPEELAAMVLAEADADPALAGIMSAQAIAPAKSGPSPEALAAMVLAEADADPALAGIMSAQAVAPAKSGPSPEELAVMVLAEADADPALAGIMSGQTSAPKLSLAEADDAASRSAAKRTPMAIPPERRAAAELGAAAALPLSLQSFMPPDGPIEPSAHARRAPDRSTRWLRLRCGEQAYALELLKVQEVVLPVPLLPLRGTPTAMLGIMNLRGQVVPVIDLGMHLGTAPIEMDTLTRVVVLEEHGETLGLRVSAVEDVTSLTDQQIEPPDNARICRINNDLFRGVARMAGAPMILLDAEQLLH